MTATVRVLVVEDDNSQFQTYKDAADDFNDSHDDICLKLERRSDAEAAKQALLSGGFDAAIVDINLDSANAAESSGNSVLREIVGKHRFPVFVVSGNLGKLDPGIREKESLFLKCYNREKANSEIYEEILTIYNTGITQILRGDGELEQRLGDIFWNHFSQDLDVWFDAGKSSEPALLRYTVSHLSEYLDMGLEDSQCYNDAEFYIKPPIRPHLATGDISERDRVRYLLLSPACDVAPRGEDEQKRPLINAKRLVLAKLINVDHADFIRNNIIKKDTRAGDSRSALSNIIKGKQDKYIFLPPYKDLEAAVIDLQDLHTVDCSDYLDEYKRLATVSAAFLKDIQSRFSSYYGRQGQPDLDKKALLNRYKDALKPGV